MFAYCLNNPSNRRDSGGDFSYKSLCDEDNLLALPWESAGGGSGGGAASSGFDWSAFLRTLQGALDGLSMAMGNRNLTRTEQHHLFSNKHKTYTPQYEKIADRYNYSLDHSSNTVSLEGHKGRHTNAYHDFMIFGLNELDAIAAGDSATFVEGMYHLGKFVENNPGLPYAKYK